jgi:hypothetical protein
MAWVVLIVASLLLLLWLASLTLCKFLHAPTSPLLTTAGGGLFSQFQERNILLVVAHPDDESMYSMLLSLLLLLLFKLITLLCLFDFMLSAGSFLQR